MSTNFAISWSRLECYEGCPLQAYWKHFAPINIRIKFDGNNPHFIKGNKWHKYMEEGLKGKPLAPEVFKFKPMVEAIRRAPGTLLVEHQLALTEKNHECEWWSKSAYWRTIYDALVVSPTAISVDWKTGKIKDTITDQLKFSAAAALIRWKEIEKIKNYYVWLDHPDEPPTGITVERKNLPAIMDEFYSRVEMVKIAVEENTWEAKPESWRCKWCPCTKSQCKHAEN